MKKISILNSKKIIIFILLIIGIILISPIISKEVYAKTGKLPDKIGVGIIKENINDNVFKILNLSEGIYTKTNEYIENDKYIKKYGYNVSPAVKEGDEFWTAKSFQSQKFDDSYQEEKSLPADLNERGPGETKINKNDGTVSPFVYSDLKKNQDVFCAFNQLFIFREMSDADIQEKLGLDPDSELVRRLKRFIEHRDAQLDSQPNRLSIHNLDADLARNYSLLDLFKAGPYDRPSKNSNYVSPVSPQEMKDRFNYTYAGSGTPTYPYIIKEIPLDDDLINGLIVPLITKDGKQQQLLNEASPYEKYNLIRKQTIKDGGIKIFYDAVDKAIQQEAGSYYSKDGDERVPDSDVDYEDIGDNEKKLRTKSYYEKSGGPIELSPQAAFALAISAQKSSSNYPGDAQRVLWTIKDGQFTDPMSDKTVQNYIIPSGAISSLNVKRLAEEFEKYYNNLKAWKEKNAGKYTPKFVDTKRNIIFNAKSESYKQGAWLIGPYKMDYLISVVKDKDKDLYFAGLVDMQVYGEYTDDKNPIKAIKQWTFFVPLKSSGEGLTENEIAAGVQTTKLKHGVPEPNQEFYLEIPYDENLIRISEIKARFKALDYEAKGQYYLGSGEYIDFDLDVAVEKFSNIALGYKDVAEPIKTGFDKIPNHDVIKFKVGFDHKVYSKDHPEPARSSLRKTSLLDNSAPYVWHHSWEKDYHLYRNVQYKDIDKNLNEAGFYYHYENPAIDGRDDVWGGLNGKISFGTPYTKELKLDPNGAAAKHLNNMKLNKNPTSSNDTDDSIKYTTNIATVALRSDQYSNFKEDLNELDYEELIKKYTFRKEHTMIKQLGRNYKIKFFTPGGQESNEITIQPKPVSPPYRGGSDSLEEYISFGCGVTCKVSKYKDKFVFDSTPTIISVKPFPSNKPSSLIDYSKKQTIKRGKEDKKYIVYTKYTDEEGKDSFIYDVPKKLILKVESTSRDQITISANIECVVKKDNKDGEEIYKKGSKYTFKKEDIGNEIYVYFYVDSYTYQRLRIYMDVFTNKYTIYSVTDNLLPNEITTNVIEGRTNKFSNPKNRVLDQLTPIDGDYDFMKKMNSNTAENAAEYNKEIKDGYTYVFHKLPDVLIVPKTALHKVAAQPQITVNGHLFYIEAEATLKEDLPTQKDTPGFLLPIGGKVWEDNQYGEKLSTYNFIFKNDEYDKNDALLEGITVRVNRLILKRADKSIVEKQAARVFAKGEYKTPIGRDDIKTNAKGEWGKYYLRDIGFTRDEINNKKYNNKDHMVKFEVEFEYDGIRHIPVAPLASLEYKASNFDLKSEEKAVNDSMAVENVYKREEFNKFVGEINGKEAITSDRKTVGKSIGVEGVAGDDTDIEYEGKLNEKDNRTESTLKYKKNMRASTLNTGILYPLGDVYVINMEQAMSEHSATSETNGAFDLVVIMDNTKTEEFKNKEGITVTEGLDNKSTVVFHESNTHMENINLGLLIRNPVDLELSSDLMLSVQFVNKKALVNTFAEKYSLEKDPNDEFSYLISQYSKEYGDLQYKLDVYKADYVYRTAMYKNTEIETALKNEAERLNRENNDTTGRELDIYLQYKQGITNYSFSDHAIVTGLNMYYDNTLTPVLNEITKETDKEEIKDDKVTGKVSVAGNDIKIGLPEYRIVTLDTVFSRRFDNVKPEPEYKDIKLKGVYPWQHPVDVEGGIKKITTLDDKYNDSTDILLPSLRRLEVVTNFKINNDALFKEDGLEITNAIRLGNKHHLTEIAGYATYNKYTGKVTGKIDRDSAPANVNLELLNFTSDGFAGNKKQDFSYLEDDTATAPVIGVELGNKDTPRKVSGMIWEEKRNYQVARVNMGDGIFNKAQGELPIPDKVVALEERIAIKAVDLSGAYKRANGFDNTILKNTSYYVDIPYIWDDKVEGAGISIDSLKAKTGFQSYVRTNKDGKYMFTGVPAGNFVTKLPYITVGNETTQKLGILDKNQIETTQIVDAANREKTVNVYNGQDFKVAIYNAGAKNVIQQTWMPVKPTANHSYGRDSEYQRYLLYLNSKTINGKVGDALETLNTNQEELSKNAELRNIVANTANMTAETPLMNLGIEYYSKKDTEKPLYKNYIDIFALPGITLKNGKIEGEPVITPVEYENVNIALEERPKTKLVLDKQITRLTIKQSDGTPIVDAKYNTTYEDIIMPAADKKVMEQEKADNKYDIKRLTTNGYITDEYILRVKTEVDKESKEGDKVTPLNTNIYATKKPYWEDKKSDSDMYTNARGWENTRVTDYVSRNSNGYILLNFDKQLLSDTNIEIEYQIQLYNLGEVDRSTIKQAFKNQTLEEALKDYRVSKYVGILAKNDETYSKLNHEIDPTKYGFGRYFGLGYYTGEFTSLSKKGNYVTYNESVAKTSANKILEYVDNSAVKDDLQNDNWTQVREPKDLENLIVAYDNTGKKTFDLTKGNLVDPNGNSYFTVGGSNIYMNEKMDTPLIPYYEYATAIARGVKPTEIDKFNLSSTIGIKRLASQQADEDLSFDNLTEVIEYSTDTGRRMSIATPGNVNTRLSETFDGKILESDTGLALLVTITPPTGLSKAQRTTFSTMNIMLVIMVGVAVAVIVAKVVIDAKSKNEMLPNEIGDINKDEHLK